MIETTYKDKRVALKEHCLVNEAINWIAFGRLPVADKYSFYLPALHEEIVDYDIDPWCDRTLNREEVNAYQQASKELFMHFLSEDIEFIADVFKVEDAGLPFMDALTKKVFLKKVNYYMVESFDFYSWEASDSKAFRNVFSNFNDSFSEKDSKNIRFKNISVETAELLKLYPLDTSQSKPNSQQNNLESYTTAYLEIMKDAISVHGLSQDEQSKKDDILVPWFQAEITKRTGETQTLSKAKMMATFVRLPDSQKGGAKKKKSETV